MIESEWKFAGTLVNLQEQATLANWSYRHGQLELKGILIEIDKKLKDCLEYMEKHNEIT